MAESLLVGRTFVSGICKLKPRKPIKTKNLKKCKKSLDQDQGSALVLIMPVAVTIFFSRHHYWHVICLRYFVLSYLPYFSGFRIFSCVGPRRFWRRKIGTRCYTTECRGRLRGPRCTSSRWWLSETTSSSTSSSPFSSKVFPPRYADPVIFVMSVIRRTCKFFIRRPIGTRPVRAPGL